MINTWGNLNTDKLTDLFERLVVSVEEINESLAFIRNELEESNLNSSPVYPEILQVELSDSATHELRQLTRAVERTIPSRQI
jgi:NADH:ubiquinone oxidoreductase subunit D